MNKKYIVRLSDDDNRTDLERVPGLGVENWLDWDSGIQTRMARG